MLKPAPAAGFCFPSLSLRWPMEAFSILGVAEDASPAEIKRAYRRLAMAWHPDRNSHPEATERFKQIRAAYDWLLNRGEDEAPDAVEPAPEPPRAADIRLDLEITLEEGAAGCRRTVTFVRGKPCATCAGTGEAGISRSRFCDACHGSGRVRHPRHGLETCPHCAGKGIFSERICPDCGGSGRDEADVALEVAVPPGLVEGDELRLAGQGEPSCGDLAPGDLFLAIHLAPQDLFELAGRNLVVTVPVSVLRLLAGGTLIVPVLGGEETLELAAGDAGPRTLRLAGKGYPGGREGQTGDLVVHLQPVVPRQLTGRQRQLLAQAAAALEENPADTLPEVAAWRARLNRR